MIVTKQHIKDQSQIRDANGFFNSNRQVGDKVGLNFSDKDLMLLSALLYAVPILLILILLPLAYLLGPKISLNADLSGFIGFVLALIFSKLVIYKIHTRLKFKVDFSTAQRQMIIPATLIVVQMKLAQIRF